MIESVLNTLRPPAADSMPPSPFYPSQLEASTDAEIDALPFGLILLDADGTVLKYNLAEARLARLDRAQVVGQRFFKTVAPCTATPEFEGRFREFVRPGATERSVRFTYLFDFKFGAQHVEVEFIRPATPGRVFVCINRRKFDPPRAGLSSDRVAPAQADLAPRELEAGVLRDVEQRRMVHVNAAFFESMQSAWARIAPQGWGVFCTEWGVQWGRLAAVDIETDVLEQTDRSLRELPMRAVAQQFDEWFRKQGWGQLGMDYSSARDGVIKLTVERGAIAESSGLAESPRCHLLAGLFQALYGHLANKLLYAREVSCVAQGYPLCSFVVVGRKRRAALDAALQRGGGKVDAVLSALREVERAP